VLPIMSFWSSSCLLGTSNGGRVWRWHELGIEMKEARSARCVVAVDIPFDQHDRWRRSGGHCTVAPLAALRLRSSVRNDSCGTMLTPLMSSGTRTVATGTVQPFLLYIGLHLFALQARVLSLALGTTT
jgi:hypothetical protein